MRLTTHSLLVCVCMCACVCGKLPDKDVFPFCARVLGHVSWITRDFLLLSRIINAPHCPQWVWTFQRVWGTYLGFAEYRVNSRFILHFVRWKDPVIQWSSSFAWFQHTWCFSLGSWAPSPFVSVHACSCTGECPSAMGGVVSIFMVGDRRYVTFDLSIVT